MVLNTTYLDPLALESVTKPRDKATDGRLPQLQSPCCSSSGITMRNQSVPEGAHAEETMWTVLNFANLVEVTAVTTLHHQFNIGK